MSEPDRLIACHECAAIYRRAPIPENARANCLRCGALLYRHIPDSLNRSLALYLAALMLWIMANLFPFLGLKVGEIYQENLLLQAGLALYEYGMGELGLVVFLTSILFPLITIVGMIYLLLPLRFGFVPAYTGRVFQTICALQAAPVTVCVTPDRSPIVKRPDTICSLPPRFRRIWAYPG